LFVDGFRKLLTYTDLFELDEALSSKNVGAQMINAWRKRSKHFEVHSPAPYSSELKECPFQPVVVGGWTNVVSQLSLDWLMSRCSLLSLAISKLESVWLESGCWRFVPWLGSLSESFVCALQGPCMLLGRPSRRSRHRRYGLQFCVYSRHILRFLHSQK